MDCASLLTGSFSTGIEQTPSVAMIEAAYRRCGINAKHIDCNVAPGTLRESVCGAIAMGWVGFSCSNTHKIEIARFLDDLGESARIIGAADCVAIRDGRLTGYNTDGQGFIRSLRSVVDPNGKSMVVLGTGDIARAIAVEAILAGVASILVVGRNQARGRSLAQQLNEVMKGRVGYTYSGSSFWIPDITDIVVSAWTKDPHQDGGQAPDIQPSSLLPRMVVADASRNSPRNRLIEVAEGRCCEILDGPGMLVNRLAAIIKYWFHLDLDSATMRTYLLGEMQTS